MPQSLTGAAIISAIKAAGIRHVLSVPDISTSDGLLFPIAADPDFALLRVCKEDETIGVAAAMSYCDTRALALFQHTGLLDSINAVRAVAVEYSLPVVMMIGLLNKEPEVPARSSAVYGVRIVEPILEAMGVETLTIDTDEDVARIAPGIEAAYAASRPLAILLGRSPAA
jgi:sulfopyruvate decarboxylase subunit alpha